ncbi:MAG TPA: polyphosphate kinase, partial [Xanthobacteraceae bacterium]|nr:polyphosphate kinase [Xanthobacteraceae bacterium]
MFDSMKIERSLDKASFKALEPGLREGLLDLQSELIAQKRCTILILINGADGVGKGAILNQLYGWLDARKLATLTYEAPTDEERARPAIWKYWRDMPAHGDIGIILGSWYHTPLETHALGGPDGAELTQALDAINHFEAMLHAEGVLLLKLWLYLDPEDAKARLKALDEGPYDRPVVREWARISSKKIRR